MADVILPDSRMETMELMYPSRKPVGNVKIDWEHPLAEGLQSFYLFNSQTTRATDIVAGSSADVVGTPKHNGVFLGSTGDNVTATNPGKFSSLQNGSTHWTIIIRGDFQGEAGGNAATDLIFNINSLVAPNDRFGLTYICNYSIANLNVFLGDGWGGFGVNTGDFSPPSTVFSDTIVCRWDGANISIKNLFTAKSSAPLVAADYPGAEITTARIGYQEGTREHLMKDFLYFSRYLNDSEIDNLNDHPYQFLIPAG